MKRFISIGTLHLMRAYREALWELLWSNTIDPKRTMDVVQEIKSVDMFLVLHKTATKDTFAEILRYWSAKDMRKELEKMGP